MPVPSVLMILEVSRKQDYIFRARELKNNIRRSAEIAYVTGSAFFQAEAPALYTEEENLVYAGGGHTVLQFESRNQAVQFARAVTEAAVRRFPGMEIFVRILPYDRGKTPGENLTALSAALEEKKARRQASFHWQDTGVTAVCDEAGEEKESKEGDGVISDEMKEKAADAAKNVAEKAGKAVKKASEIAEKAAKKTSEMAEKAAGKVDDIAEKAAEKAEKAAEKAVDKLKE